jgi:hypothetical protein
VILKGPVTCEITLDNVPSSGNITLSLPANLTNIVFYTSSSSHPQYDANGKLILNDAVQFINVTWSNLVTGYAKVEFVFNATFTIGSISSPPVNGDNPVLSVDFNPSSLTVYPYPYYTSIVANVTATKNATTLGHGSIIFTSPILPNGNTFTADFFGTIVLAPSAIVPMLDYPPLNSCCPEIDEAFNNYTNAVICLFKSSHVFTSALKVAAFDVPLIIYDLVSCFKNVCDDDAVRKKIVKIIKRLALNVNDNASYLVSVNRSLSTLENICTNCVQCDGNNTNVPSKRLDDIEASLHKLLKATSANKSNVDELIQQLKRLKMKDRL